MYKDDDRVYIMIDPENPYSVLWSENEADLISYGVQNGMKEYKDYRIVSMKADVFMEGEFDGKYKDEVFEYQQGVYVTESEQEMISQCIDTDISGLINDIESLIHQLKFITGDDAKKARKALQRLLEDPDIPEWLFDQIDSVDDIDEFMIMEAKLNLPKYIKRSWGRRHKKKDKSMAKYNPEPDY